MVELCRAFNRPSRGTEFAISVLARTLIDG
jgi:hypothetical protein